MSAAAIPVDCCCNDDHGNVTDRVNGIEVPGLDLTPIDMAGVHFRALRGDGIRVSRRKWPAVHLISHIGNIYWERYGMEPWTAAAFLHYLRSTKLFTPEGGYVELFDWFSSNITDEAHVRQLLIDAAKDDRL